MTNGLIAVAVMGLLAFFLELAKKAPNTITKEGELELRFHPVIIWSGFLAAMAGCLMPIVVAFFHPPKSTGDFFAILIMMLMFGWGGGYFFVKRRARVLVSEEGIKATYAFGRDREMRWEDVQKVTYSNMSGHYILRSATEKIGVFGYSVGIRDFAAILQHMVPPENRKKAQGYLDNMHG